MDNSDQSLVARCRAGDHAAFSDLYLRYRALVGTILRDRGVGADERPDLQQAVFTKALESLGTLRDPAKFRPWISSIARHIAVDAWRAGGRSVPIDDLELVDPAPGPDQVVEDLQMARVLEAALMELSERDALALSLVGLGFSSEEIGQTLAITPGTAKVVVHRARRRLARVATMRRMLDKGSVSGPTGHDTHLIVSLPQEGVPSQ